MRYILHKLVCSTVFALAAITTASAKIAVDRVDPPHWWVGMRDSSLQLQIHGKEIRGAVPEINYPGVSIDSVVRLDGTDSWQHIYLSISPEAKAGTMEIVWRAGKQTVKRKYELRERSAMRGAKGFDASDVLYMVMPDRFSDGDTTNNLVKSMRHPVGATRSDLNKRHGGDLKGIMNHIGYIDSLGVTAVWLNPVLENDIQGGSYHGYATTDYYAVDPRLGSNAEYSELIARLHDRGIKTVMDMIFNHSGSTHPWFEERPSSDWYNFSDGYQQTNYRLSTITDPYATDYDRKLSTDGWFVKEMPDLNQRNPHLMKYLIQNSIWWIEESGIDGIRMDTYPYADKRAMAEWIAAVEREYPDFKIVGECWFTDPAGEAYWQRGSKVAPKGEDTNLPVVMDFSLMTKCREMKPFTEQTDPWNGLNKIYDHLALDYIYADPMNILRFLDNHDTERFILTVPDSLDQWKQAVTTLLTIPGIPQLYYGTELLMAGDRKLGDGNVRRDMPGGFPGDRVNAFLAEGRTALQNEAFDFLSTLLHWRKGSAAIAKGSMRHFMPTNGIYLYERSYNGEDVIVVMNGNDSAKSVDMSRYLELLPQGESYRDILTDEQVTLIPASGVYEFKPRETRILVK